MKRSLDSASNTPRLLRYNSKHAIIYSRGDKSQHTPPCAFDFPHLIEFYFVTGLGSSSIEINCTMFLVCCDSFFYFSPLTYSSWSTQSPQSQENKKYTCNDTRADYGSKLKARFGLCSVATVLRYFICFLQTEFSSFYHAENQREVLCWLRLDCDGQCWSS